MNFSRIRHKMLAVLGVTLSLGFIMVTYYYNEAIERSILAEYERTLHRMTDSVVMSIETIMTEDHAEIMPEYARRLKALSGLIDFRIARIDGTEAYNDNQTIAAVNAKLGSEDFLQRKWFEEKKPVFSVDDPAVAKLLAGSGSMMQRETAESGGNVMHFYDTIPSGPRCTRCHSDQKIRGIIKVTASLAEIEREMASARIKSLTILIVALFVTMGGTGYMLGRTVAEPIEQASQAMKKISGGNFDAMLASGRNDELGRMANSFNLMTANVRQSYGDMLREQEKLATVIQGAGEAVVAANGEGKIVLVNDAACELLGKSEDEIRAGGIVGLVNQQALFQSMLDTLEDHDPVLVEHAGRWLLASVSCIRDEAGSIIGSAALLRDVTREQTILAELRRISTTDALTDVYNRRHLDATLKNEMQRAQEQGLHLSVIMFDADHFKKFNDTYGHDQGDRVLKMVGQVMRNTVREYDVPCRYGGEEFSVILPCTDAEGAHVVAERLRTAVEAMRVDGLQVTISLGIATYPDLAARSPEQLVAAADAALYHSKENGRNCSTIATADMISFG